MYEIMIPDRLWYLPITVITLLFGIGNTVAHSLRDTSEQHGKGWKHTISGMVSGALIGTLLQFVGLIPRIGPTIQIIILSYCLLQASIGIIGVLTGLLNKGMKGVKQGVKITLGLLYLDESSVPRAILQGFLRHTWEMPQTFVGQTTSHIRNAASNVSRVDYYGGVTFVINDKQRFQDGLSLGNYVNVNLWDGIFENFDTHIKHDPLLLHEYGHTIDSNIFGWFYLFVIGIPSIHSAMGKGNHQIFWTEKRANRKIKRYAKKYHDIAWNAFEDEYPTA